jgi:hypothetical protein
MRETAVGVSEARAIPAPAKTPGPLSLAEEAIGGVSGVHPTRPPRAEVAGLRYGVRGQRLLSGEGGRHNSGQAADLASFPGSLFPEPTSRPTDNSSLYTPGTRVRTE